MDGMKQVLFLCSGNYYRSRFAEHLFNWLAPKASLPWGADSRGLRAGQYGNIGPISRFAVEGLKLRGIPINGEHRYPLELSLSELAGSDLVIAVKEGHGSLGGGCVGLDLPLGQTADFVACRRRVLPGSCGTLRLLAGIRGEAPVLVLR